MQRKDTLLRSVKLCVGGFYGRKRADIVMRRLFRKSLYITMMFLAVQLPSCNFGIDQPEPNPPQEVPDGTDEEQPEPSPPQEVPDDTDQGQPGTPPVEPPVERPQHFQLSIVSIGEGFVDAPSGIFESGAEVALVAHPANGYRFDRWTGDVDSTTNPLVIVIERDLSITAIFVRQFTLTVHTTGDGAVELDPPGGLYDSGTDVTLRALPNAGSQFDHWSGDLSGSVAQETLRMDTNRSVTAVFITTPSGGVGGPTEPLSEVELIVSTRGQGSVVVAPTVSARTVSDGQAFNYPTGTLVSISAIDTADACFSSFSGDLSSRQRDIQLVLTQDSFLLVTFVSHEAAPAAPLLASHATMTAASSIMLSGDVPATCKEAATIVEIDGPAGTITTPVMDGRFETLVPLAINRANYLNVTPITADGTRGTPAFTIITQDSEPPKLFVDFPGDGAQLTNSAIDVAGRVSDTHSGFLGLNVTVNAVPATVDVGIGTNGTFVRPAVPLQFGRNVFIVTATDALGNTATREVTVTRVPVSARAPQIQPIAGNGQSARINELLAAPISVRITNPDGSPFVDKLVTFDVTRSDGRLNEAPLNIGGSATLQVRTDANGQARAFWRLGSDAGTGNNRVEATSAGVEGTAFFCASANSGPAAQINVGTGNGQRGETDGFAQEPLRAWVSDGCNGVGGIPVTFMAVQGGGRVNNRSAVTVVTSATGHAEVDFTFGPRAGNHEIEADFPGNPGAPAGFVLYAVKRGDGVTNFSGLVLNNSNQPLQGASVLLRAEGQSFNVLSDIDGLFRFADLPVSGPADLFVSGLSVFHVGGASGQDVPQGSYPSLHFEPLLIPKADNSLGGGPVLLPPLDPANARVFDNTQDVELKIEGVEGLRMIIKAGSMRRPDGSVPSPASPAIVTLNQVHHDKVPMPMPDGAAPPFAWTLQPGGATFNPPVEVYYPNMTGLPAGSIAYFLSFNHETMRFEIVASGSVSADGSTIHTDPGAGITTAGWGCNCPPYSVTADCEECPTPQEQCEAPDNACPSTCSIAGDCGCSDGRRCRRRSVCTAENCVGEQLVCGDTNELECLIEMGFTACNDIGYTLKGRADAENERVVQKGLLPASNIGGTSNAFHHLFWQCITTRKWGADKARYVGDFHEVEACGRTDANSIFDTIADLHNNEIGRELGQNATSDEECLQFALAIANGNPAFRPAIVDRTEAGTAGAQIPPPINCPEEGGAPIPRRTSILGGFSVTVEPERIVLQKGTTRQLRVQLQSPSGDVEDRTAFSTGTRYSISETQVAVVSPDGLVSGVASGATTLHISIPIGEGGAEGTFAESDVLVGLPGDSDSDGLPDDFEIALGLDPLSAGDSADDLDGDHLNNFDEFVAGTDPTNPDTDGDGRKDDVELLVLRSDPLSFDIGLDTADWTVSVNGQTVTVNPDGSFRLSNVSAADQFGPDGPGTRPDFLSDEELELTGFGLVNGVPMYVISAPFRLRQGETFFITDLFFRDTPPPKPISIRATASPDEIVVNQTSQMTVMGTLLGGSQVNISGSDSGTTYRVSNTQVASINAQGLLTGLRPGTVFVTATNHGATSVDRVDIVAKSTFTTVEGLVRDAGGQGLAGADVTTSLGGTTSTNSIGQFTLSLEAPIGGAVSATASAIINGEALTGHSDTVAVVSGGVTDVGIIVLVSQVPSERVFAVPVALSSAFPAFLESGDVDFDGDVDLVVLDFDNNIDVLRNGGDGNFESGASLRFKRLRNDTTVDAFNVAGGFVPSRQMSLVDLDGDRDLDIVALDTNNIGAVNIFINDGHGSFSPPVDVTSGIILDRFLTGDFDSDDDEDLALVSSGLGRVTLLFNEGDGVFGQPAIFETGGSSIQDIDVADMDEDQDLDVVLVLNTSTGNRIFIAFNDGRGGLAGTAPVSTGSEYVLIQAVDIDGDSDMDLVASTFDDRLHVLSNDGDMNFVRSQDYDLNNDADMLRVVDITGDALPEILVLINEIVTVFPHKGSGSFGHVRHLNTSTDDDDTLLVTGDWDGDGDLDLGTAERFTNGVALHFNNGLGWFPVDATYYDDDSFSNVAVGDIDGDGDLDVIAVDGMTVFHNDGRGILRPDLRIDFPGCPDMINMGHFDSGGDLDVVGFDQCTQTVIVLFNMRDGSPQRVKTVFPENQALNDFFINIGTAADINLDGLDDVIVASGDQLQVLLASPSGQFAAPVSFGLNFFIPALIVTNIDADASPDLALAVVGGNDTGIQVLFGDGQGGFRLGPLSPVENPEFLAAADVDLDGDVDLVVGDGRSTLQVLLGDGSGAFVQSAQLDLSVVIEDRSAAGGSFSSRGLKLADVGGDERIDIVIGHRGTRFLQVFLNISAESPLLFRDAGVYDAGTQMEAVAAADFNGDGEADIVAAGFGVLESGSVSILFNRRQFRDCNGNGRADDVDIAIGATDCNFNGAPDECDADCNGNSVIDFCEIYFGDTRECKDNFVPDECEPDCNSNGQADRCDIDFGFVADCNLNGVPDDCDIAAGATDFNGDGVPDQCIQACCLSAGTLCQHTPPDQCISLGGFLRGLGVNCQGDNNGNSIDDACE